jgi:L-fucose dehydrogenase
METGLRDKVVIVTGGASGIGKETVLSFAAEGAIPIIVDKDKQKGETLSDYLREKRISLDFLEEKRINHDFFHGDLRDEWFCREVIDKTVGVYDRIDVLVNNAGKNDRCGIENTSPDGFRKSLEGNLVHYYTMSHYAWPFLKESKGNIVCVSSKVAFIGSGENGGTTAYAAAKGAINSIVKELASYSCKEKHGIRVNGVAPGIVRTPLFDEYMMERWGSIEEGIKEFCKDIPLDQKPTSPKAIANVILFLSSDYLSPHTTGQIIIPDGGYCSLDRSI